MRQHMPPSKTWWPSLKVVIFSPVMRLVLDNPKTVTTPEIIDQIHQLILDDGRISAKSMAGQVGISREWVGSIIHEDLHMRKLSAKWDPKYLNAEQKRQRCQLSEQLLEFFFDPETKQQSMESRHSVSPRPKKFRVQKSAGKFISSIF